MLDQRYLNCHCDGECGRPSVKASGRICQVCCSYGAGFFTFQARHLLKLGGYLRVDTTLIPEHQGNRMELHSGAQDRYRNYFGTRSSGADHRYAHGE